jgi:OOP family OmpA-OmpF porin
MKKILAFSLVFYLFLPITNMAKAQWYVGGGLTQAEADQGLGFDRPPITETDDSTEIAWKLVAGYDFSPTFAMEFTYSDLGDEFTTFNIFGNNEKTEMDVTAIYTTIIGRNQVYDGVDFFGRIGLAFWKVDLDYTEAGFDSNDSDNDLDLVVGLGFAWHLTDLVVLRTEWEQFQNVGDEVKTNTPSGSRLELNGQDFNVLGIGLTYGF